jgi:hypothetical protein
MTREGDAGKWRVKDDERRVGTQVRRASCVLKMARSVRVMSASEVFTKCV